MTEATPEVVSDRKITRVQALTVVGIIISLLLPFIIELIPSVTYRSIFRGLTYGLAAVGVAMLLRHLRLVSFGHAAFFGVGAYTVALLANYLEVSSMFLLLLSSILVSSTFGAIIGLLVRNHRGIFFGLLTLALNQVIYTTVASLDLFNYTDGISVRVDGQRPSIFGLQLELEVYNILMHYLTIGIIIVGLYCVWRIQKSPFGRTINAIGQDRVRAKFIGIDVQRYVLITFMITSVYAGIGGGLFALFELHVRPDPTLHILRSGEILFMSILGGVETIIGPVIGGTILVYLLDTMHTITEYFDFFAGITLIAIVFLLPKGISGPDYLEYLSRIRNNPKVILSWLQTLIQ
jgi:branched-chain amino acid transport system permease protein